MTHFIDRTYEREIHHASMLLAVQRRIAQADLIIDRMENAGCKRLKKLRQRSRLFEREADRLFQELAGRNALLDNAVEMMARSYRAAARKADGKKKRAQRR